MPRRIRESRRISENLALGRILGRAQVGAKQLGKLGFDCSVRFMVRLLLRYWGGKCVKC